MSGIIAFFSKFRNKTGLIDNKKDLVVLVGEEETTRVGGDYRFRVMDLSGGASTYLAEQHLQVETEKDRSVGNYFVVTNLISDMDYRTNIGNHINFSRGSVIFTVGVYNRNNSEHLEAMVNAVRERQKNSSQKWGLFTGSTDQC